MLRIREEAFKWYLYFMQERMNIFWERNNKKNHFMSSLTNDSILSEYKFTNVYRVCDRVSQYLVKNVIYSDKDKFIPKDQILRVLLFKIFNRIDTWQYLENRLGTIKFDNFDEKYISLLLEERIKKQPIFSAAYLMTGTHSTYSSGFIYKHEKWLHMLKTEIMNDEIVDRILNSRSLSELYEILINCTFIGPFLAYQYAIDLNYTEIINFDENSFVMAGIGAIRGIKKCFIDIGKYSYEDVIKYTADNMEFFREKYGYSFKNLYGRAPTLIDLQNCYCETDKYLRVKMPDLIVGNKRIKQKFKRKSDEIDFLFPPKWNLTLD
ncbi:nucleotide kinase domain-containing protein [Desulfoluna spongiiphila]|uniref:5-hmdU DNA kinase helical domain-containing protein n=1 Tax=Desulfoluna spongiiphila TaxID=419481 RepID=A0A1G5JQ87_9BACT|nr:nucleotide kinase domain-containing protein [Desulfoluna spongiiphila]SCY90582.1 hypothetical protein SAMN05216233_14010 [Desulfoluna spongiiphila]